MAEIVSTSNFRNGMHIALDGQNWRIVEFQHVKPGKGGAFVRTKVKSIDSGSVVDRTFRAGEKFPRVFTEVKNIGYELEPPPAEFVEQWSDRPLENRLGGLQAASGRGLGRRQL